MPFAYEIVMYKWFWFKIHFDQKQESALRAFFYYCILSIKTHNWHFGTRKSEREIYNFILPCLVDRVIYKNKLSRLTEFITASQSFDQCISFIWLAMSRRHYVSQPFRCCKVHFHKKKCVSVVINLNLFRKIQINVLASYLQVL